MTIKLVHSKERDLYENKLVDEIKALIYSYEGKINVAAVFGCLKIIDVELTRELL